MHRKPWLIAVLLVLVAFGGSPLLQAADYRVGTWKTAQTIQPFF